VLPPIRGRLYAAVVNPFRQLATIAQALSDLRGDVRTLTQVARRASTVADANTATLTHLSTNQAQALAALTRLEARMSAHSDALAALTAATAKLDADSATEEATLTALVVEVEDLKAKLNATPEDDTAQIQALTAQITALDERINAAQAAAAGELRPAGATVSSA